MSSPTAVPPAPTPEAIGLSEPQRIINVFAAPSKTFEDIKRNSSWWVPWLLISIVTLAFSYTFDHKIGWDGFMEQQIAKNPSAQARMESLKPEQREKILETQSKVARVFGYAAPVIVLISWVVIAAILMAICNFGFGAEIPFKQSLAVLAYVQIPMVIHSILGIITMYATPDTFNMNNPVASNLGAIFKPEDSRLLYWLGSCVDVFAIWVIILMGIGYSVVSNNKVKRNTLIIILAVLYVAFKGFGAMRA